MLGISSAVFLHVAHALLAMLRDVGFFRQEIEVRGKVHGTGAISGGLESLQLFFLVPGECDGSRYWPFPLVVPSRAGKR